MLLTIILCVYNERSRIEPSLQELNEFLIDTKFGHEIIILDNGSTDGTREWLSANPYPNTTLIFNRNNLGKGGSIRYGINMAKGDYILIHDPDMEYRAKDIKPLIDLALHTNADLCLGSRVLGGENISYKYLQNYLGVAALTKIINILYSSKITDPATAMKLMKASFIKQIKLINSGFNLDFEIVVKCLRLKGIITETRISYYPRTKAEGKKLNAWKDGLASLITIITSRIKKIEQLTV